MNIKITFFMPPPMKGYKIPDRLFGCNYSVFYQQNIFILYSAAVLKKEGYEIKVIDAPAEKMDYKKFIEFLRNDYSDVYVFYTVFLSEEIDKYWAKKIREIGRTCHIIFLGSEPTSRPSDFIIDSHTFVVRGEPEETIKELIKYLSITPVGTTHLFNINGISWASEGKIIHNPPREIIENIDEIPFPARHLLKKEEYYNPKLKGRPSIVALTSRACFAQCSFCIPNSYMFAREIEHRRYFGRKPPVRLRSPQNIYEEFEQIKKEGYEAIAIIDDNFMGLKRPEDKERILEICRLIKPLGLEWGVLSRADQLQDEEVLKAMKDAGCVYIDIGIESFNQKVLDYIKKGLKIGDNFGAILLLQKVGIEPKLNILFGASPYETEEDIRWTVDILKKLDVDWVSFDVVIPHRDTEFYKIVKESGWFATKSGDFEPVDPMREATVNFPNGLSHEDLSRLVKWAYRSYYFRPKYIWKRLSKLTSFHELKELIGTVWRLFG